MLVLSRRTEEILMIGDDIAITILDIQKNSVRLGIKAPPGVDVRRKEICEQILRKRSDARQARGEQQGDSFVSRPAPSPGTGQKNAEAGGEESRRANHRIPFCHDELVEGGSQSSRPASGAVPANAEGEHSNQPRGAMSASQLGSETSRAQLADRQPVETHHETSVQDCEICGKSVHGPQCGTTSAAGKLYKAVKMVAWATAWHLKAACASVYQAILAVLRPNFIHLKGATMTKKWCMGHLVTLAAMAFVPLGGGGCDQMRVNAMTAEFGDAARAVTTSIADQAAWKTVTAGINGQVACPGIEGYAGMMYVAGGKLTGVSGQVNVSGTGEGTGVVTDKTRDAIIDMLKKDDRLTEALVAMLTQTPETNTATAASQETIENAETLKRQNAETQGAQTE